jgi:hypothetical protein
MNNLTPIFIISKAFHVMVSPTTLNEICLFDENATTSKNPQAIK